MSASTGKPSRTANNEPGRYGSAGAYVARIAPVVATRLSTSRSDRTMPSSGSHACPRRGARGRSSAGARRRGRDGLGPAPTASCRSRQVLSVLPLQGGHGLGEVTLQQGRVLPLEQLGEGPGSDVLRQPVQRPRDGLRLLGSRRLRRRRSDTHVWSGRRDSNPRPPPWQGGSGTHGFPPRTQKPLLRGHIGISPYRSVLFLLRHVCGTLAAWRTGR